MIDAALVIDSAALVSGSPDGKIMIRDNATGKLKLFHSRSIVPIGISVHFSFCPNKYMQFLKSKG